jgi:hypothetical protein
MPHHVGGLRRPRIGSFTCYTKTTQPIDSVAQMNRVDDKRGQIVCQLGDPQP